MNESLATANEWSHALLSVIVWLLVLHVKLCSQSLDFVLRVDHILRRWMGGEVRCREQAAGSWIVLREGTHGANRSTFKCRVRERAAASDAPAERGANSITKKKESTQHMKWVRVSTTPTECS
jgi:hypothetical protein